VNHMHSPKQLIVRLPKEDHALVEKAAQQRDESVSTFARRAILKELAALGMLGEERKRLLGVN